MSKPRTRLDVSQKVMCVGEAYFFFLPVFFFAFLAFLAFLAMLPSTIPIGSVQVDLDVHPYRVHHNCKIDTARFEEGKRWSHPSIAMGEALLRCVNAILAHGLSRKHPRRD
jgi:hypothetical protein